ncbi:MAG: ATP-binding protein [Betaproteobacteria bacterium]|nr:ATP-binding protein [Betaproteobacteria bacterium]
MIRTIRTFRVRVLLLMLAAASPPWVALAWFEMSGSGGTTADVLAGCALITLGILAIVWTRGATFLLGSMASVVATVRRMAHGDLSARSTMEQRHQDEIGKLASEVDRMAEALSLRDQALTETRDRAQAYLDIVGVMVLALNTKGNVALANRKTCEVLDCTPDAFASAVNWFDNWVPEDNRASARDMFAHILAGHDPAGTTHQGMVLTTRHERRLIAWHNTALKDTRGQIIGMLSAGDDITERVKVQAEKERLQAQLQQAQKMEALGQLTGGIAHDFNNILASVLGFAKLALRRHTPDPESPLASYLNEIIAAGERARDLVAKMLAFGRLRPKTAPSLIDPGPVVLEAAQMLAATIPSTIRIHTNVSESLPKVPCDPVALQQILMNLVINARDAVGGKGQILLGLRQRHAERLICTACLKPFSGSLVELTVADDGTGIAPDVLPRIFDPFFTTKEVGLGSGMGLSMVHGLVHQAGGHFVVESQPAIGTIFRVYLPTATGSAESAPSALPSERTAQRPQTPQGAGKGRDAGGRSGHVLLVDDDPGVLRLQESIFKAAHWQVTCFSNPVQALGAFQAAPDRFDAVISDQIMPDLTGTDMIRAMLALRPDLHAILCTGHSGGIDATLAGAMGIRHFFLKPVEPDALLAALAVPDASPGTHPPFTGTAPFQK